MSAETTDSVSRAQYDAVVLRAERAEARLAKLEQ